MLNGPTLTSTRSGNCAQGSSVTAVVREDYFGTLKFITKACVNGKLCFHLDVLRTLLVLL